MASGGAIAKALEVRRGRLSLASLPAAEAIEVKRVLGTISDAQLARVARSQEAPRGRYRVRA